MSRLTSAAMFELIIFDMDGVLVDSEDAMAQMTVRALEEWGIHSSPDDFTRFRGMGDRAYVGGVSEMYGVPYEMYEKYSIRRYGAHGTSHRYAAQQAAYLLNRPLQDLGLITCHLGSGGSISVTNTEGFAALGGKVGRVPYILFLVLILGIIAAVILGKCTFGRRVYAIGTNRLAAYYSGIHVQKIRFVIYTLMGTISGLCALFLMSSSFGANTTTGNGFEMDAIAMAVFGGISSTGGKGNIAGGLISAFIIVCLRVGLGQRNIHPQVILLIIGVLLIGAVALPNIIKEIQKKAKTAK